MSEPRTTLRSATPADSEAVAALAIQVFLDTYATDGVRPDLAREAFAEYSDATFALRLADPVRRFVVAERGIGLIGFAEVITSQARSAANGVSGAELVRLYVQPKAQRSGVGKNLLAAAERIASDCSSPVLWLTAWDGNVRARAFYARMGYSDVGATTYVLQGHAYANRVLAKNLSTEAPEV